MSLGLNRAIPEVWIFNEEGLYGLFTTHLLFLGGSHIPNREEVDALMAGLNSLTTKRIRRHQQSVTLDWLLGAKNLKNETMRIEITLQMLLKKCYHWDFGMSVVHVKSRTEFETVLKTYPSTYWELQPLCV
ncbi:hypothetical protein H7Y40_02645 [Pedobacter sp.]|nr:hypothetical protein [Candidatus Saccharibacteria bacterium]